MKFGATVTLLAALVPLSASAAFDHSAWNQLLVEHVQPIEGSTQIDYAGVWQDHSELAGYLKALSGVEASEFEQWPEDEKLAFLINAYNAFTVELIVQNQQTAVEKGDELESIRDIGSFFSSPWKQSFFTLLGEGQTLDGIEHGLIRGSASFSEPRIHFAVNCASVGCPALRASAYTADQLDQQLHEQTVSFLSDASRNRYNAHEQQLEVSHIFKWYREDFDRSWPATRTRLPSSSLESFLAAYANELGLPEVNLAELKAGDIDIEFLPYDWALNEVPVE